MRAWGHDQTDFQMTPVQEFIDWPLYKIPATQESAPQAEP
jgi:hypothetical protein